MRTDYPGVPEGYHTATPYLMVRDADQAVEFYRNAFGAVELRRSTRMAWYASDKDRRLPGDARYSPR